MKVDFIGIIYLHSIGNARYGFIAERNLRIFKKLCGDQAMGSVVLATTFWDSTKGQAHGPSQEQRLRDYWKDMIDNGSTLCRHDGGRISARAIVSYLIKKQRPVKLVIQWEMVDKGMTLLQTGAGAILAADIEKRIENLEDELKEAEKIGQEIVDLKKAEELDSALERILELDADIKAEEKALEKLAVDCDQLYWQEKARIGMS
jgi:hypothetical protein